MPPKPSSPLGRAPRTGTLNGSSFTTGITAPTPPHRPLTARRHASNSNARGGWTGPANALASWPARHAKAGSQPVPGLVMGPGPGQAFEPVNRLIPQALSANGEVL